MFFSFLSTALSFALASPPAAPAAPPTPKQIEREVDDRDAALKAGERRGSASLVNAKDLADALAAQRSPAMAKKASTALTLLVDGAGNLEDCNVTGSSGTAALDALACETFAARGKFLPARTHDRTAVGGQARVIVYWGAAPLPQVVTALETMTLDATMGARPRRNPASLFSVYDYPRVSLANDSGGLVRVIMDVDREGRVDGCTIVQSSGDAALDGHACRTFMRNLTFHPATDADGQPVASRFGPQAIMFAINGDTSRMTSGEDGRFKGRVAGAALASDAWLLGELEDGKARQCTHVAIGGERRSCNRGEDALLKLMVGRAERPLPAGQSTVWLRVGERPAWESAMLDTLPPGLQLLMDERVAITKSDGQTFCQAQHAGTLRSRFPPQHTRLCKQGELFRFTAADEAAPVQPSAEAIRYVQMLLGTGEASAVQ